MNTNRVSTESTQSTPSVFSRTAAQSRVTNHLGHSLEIINHLENQHKDVAVAHKYIAAKIYSSARKELNNIQFELREKLKELGDKQGNLSQKDIKTFAKLLHKAEKESAKVIQNAQNQFRSHLTTMLGTKESNTNLKNIDSFQEHINALAKGGVKAKIIKLLSNISTTHRAAVKHFNAATKLMENAASEARNKITNSSFEKSHVNMDKRDQIGGNHIDNRVGVVGIGKMYSIGVAFDLKTIQKQTKSFIAQKISSDIIREPIVKDVSVKTKDGQLSTITSILIPLNGHFDTANEIAKDTQSATRVFAKTFGEEGGISSANRQEAHLINGWETKLENAQGKEVYRALRHAITSDKYQTNQIARDVNSKQAAKELLTAVIMQELSSKGLSLEDAAKGGRIPISFTSVSLVTPDDLRTIGTKGANEKTMLRDQINALKEFEGEHTFNIGGNMIQVDFSVNTFNFGVNAGAVDLGLGTFNQYEENVKGLKGLQEDIQKLKDNGKEVTPQMESVLKDIQFLMRNRKAYLEGGNQFEVGAKVLLLQNMMREVNGGQGAWCAFNCMSGKDRTGVMDAIAKTFALMRNEDPEGRIPTHADLEKDPKVQARFRELVVPMLLESGNLEITQTNTGVMGYKVTKHALIGGISEDVFLSMIGLSKTTSS